MRPPHFASVVFALLIEIIAARATAAVVVDDTWADGNRTNTNLTSDSAWYASSGTSLTVATGMMSGSTSTSNRTWWTYFTTDAATPLQLSVGDTLKATITFSLSGVNTSNTARGLQIGLYNFSGGARTTSDGSSPSGTSVAGFMASVNVGQTFGVDNPLQISQRTTPGSSALMSSNSDYTLLNQNSGSLNQTAFSNGASYTAEMSATKTASSVIVTTTISGPNNFNITTTGTTNSIVDAFDGFGFRATSTAQTATSFNFTRFKVEVLTGTTTAPSITGQPQNQTVMAGQTANFSVAAGGTAPLSYQWLKNNGTITSATNSSLTLMNVQAGDMGGYSATVSNSAGTIASSTATLTVTAATAPSITTQPQSQTVNAGQSATLSVSATGTQPLSYQWSKNNAPISSATSSALTFGSVQSNDAGSYAVAVSNAAGSITSGTATLTVNTPNSPSITTQPHGQTVTAGQNATFTMTADGTAPLTYQWLKNNAAITGATNASLTISNAQTTDGASYTVVVTNAASSITSDAAVLTVSNAPPVITLQPASQSVLLGSTVNLAVSATGSGILAYQWFKNSSPVGSATSSTLTFTSTQSSDSYAVNVSNTYGNVTSNAAIVTIATSLPFSAFNLTGFGRGASGGGIIPETDAGYRKVTTPLELANALVSFNKTGAVKVIEIMNDLDLGWNEIGAAVQNLASTPFTEAATPQLHPKLIQTGVSKVDIKYKNGGLTIFSANGATIRHCTFNIKSTSNIIIRNLKFDEMWEWDEATKGGYDKNDWDFIDIGNGGVVNNVWIDHCTFTKTYDGIIDTKGGSYNITFSWNKYVGDDEATNPNSFVRQQINALEANRSSYAMYNFLRTNGFSVEDIVQIHQGHDKTHLLGANSLDSANAAHTMTIHHSWAMNLWDRAMPRLRAGNVHDYNNYIDDTGVLAAKRLRDTHAAAMSTANQNTLNNTYSFNPPINGSISTEGGALLVEKSIYTDCLWPLRNNQTDPSDSTYTGKIKALDTIYNFHNTNGTTTTMRGNSTDANSPLGPFQATIIPFSWNLTNNQLPYTYTMDDPAQLASILASGAGAGTLTWSKDNWLKTTYSTNVPVITQQPSGLARNIGDAATFSVSATSSTTLNYQWRRDGVAITSATNSTYTILSVNWSDDAGYSVIVSNADGSVASATAALDIPGASYVSNYGLDPATDGAPNADPDSDGIPNRMEWFLNGDPTQAEKNLLPTITRAAGNNTCVFEFNRRKDAANVAYTVQYSTDLKNWSNAVNGQNGVTIGTSSINGTLDHITVTIPSDGLKVFVRLHF